jgi:hypothetical protein
MIQLEDILFLSALQKEEYTQEFDIATLTKITASDMFSSITDALRSRFQNNKYELQDLYHDSTGNRMQMFADRIKELRDENNTISELLYAIKHNDIGKLIQNSSFFGLVLAPVLAGVAITIVSIIIYRRYLSAAGKSCRGTSGENKDNCLNKYRIKALEASNNYLKTQIKTCSKSKNPTVCKNKIDDRIQHNGIKIRKLQTKLK